MSLKARNVSRDMFEKKYSRVNCVAAILGGNVDVFDLAARGRERKAIFLETFQMKLDGLTDERFGFCHCCARGNATRQIGNIRRIVYRGLLDYNGVTHVSLLPFSNLLA